MEGEWRCSPKCCTVCEVDNKNAKNAKNCYETAYHLTNIEVCDCGWGLGWGIRMGKARGAVGLGCRKKKMNLLEKLEN